MRTFTIVCAVLILAASQAFAQVVPMDQQINLGAGGTSQSPSGDAIYTIANGTITFETDGVEGWARNNIAGDGWYYFYLDLSLAGVGGVNVGAAGSTVEFDCRYFRNPDDHEKPYDDAPIFLNLYTYSEDGNTLLGRREYGIVWGTQGPWNNDPYPTWTHMVIDVHGLAHTDYDAFDPSNVNRIRWWGTDWSGKGNDFVDIKNFSAVPEPGTMAVLLAGFAGLIPAIRRRK